MAQEVDLLPELKKLGKKRVLDRTAHVTAAACGKRKLVSALAKAWDPQSGSLKKIKKAAIAATTLWGPAEFMFDREWTAKKMLFNRGPWKM